jgi:hypothetical protein
MTIFDSVGSSSFGAYIESRFNARDVMLGITGACCVQPPYISRFCVNNLTYEECALIGQVITFQEESSCTDIFFDCFEDAPPPVPDCAWEDGACVIMTSYVTVSGFQRRCWEETESQCDARLAAMSEQTDLYDYVDKLDWLYLWDCNSSDVRGVCDAQEGNIWQYNDPWPPSCSEHHIQGICCRYTGDGYVPDVTRLSDCGYGLGYEGDDTFIRFPYACRTRVVCGDVLACCFNVYPTQYSGCDNLNDDWCNSVHGHRPYGITDFLACGEIAEQGIGSCDGACCHEGRCIWPISSNGCAMLGGTFLGSFTNCQEDPCGS